MLIQNSNINSMMYSQLNNTSSATGIPPTSSAQNMVATQKKRKQQIPKSLKK